LLAERTSTGSIAFGRFWGRRLRRLVPALLLMLVIVAVFARTVYSPTVRSVVRDDMPWVLTYLENWHLAVGNATLGSPLSHTWSLGIEEQWYLLWPIVLVLVMWSVRDRRVRGAVVLTALAVASMVWGGHLADGSLARAYFGTDVRAQELLVGAALAVLGIYSWRAQGRWARRTVSGAGLVALSALLVIGLSVEDSSEWFPAGRLGLAVLAAIVIAAAVAPSGPVRVALAWTPLVLIGQISYGLYLFHFPIFGWLNPERVGFGGTPLMLLRCAVVGAVAVGSYLLIEQPIRTGRWRATVLVPVGAVVAVGVVAAMSIGVPALLPAPRNTLLAYALGRAAVGTPRGEHGVLVVGGTRATTLGRATGGP
jgi:peptidoglycan/LPS O-acetylase OafA/YrhL